MPAAGRDVVRESREDFDGERIGRGAVGIPRHHGGDVDAGRREGSFDFGRVRNGLPVAERPDVGGRRAFDGDLERDRRAGHRAVRAALDAHRQRAAQAGQVEFVAAHVDAAAPDAGVAVEIDVVDGMLEMAGIDAGGVGHQPEVVVAGELGRRGDVADAGGQRRRARVQESDPVRLGKFPGRVVVDDAIPRRPAIGAAASKSRVAEEGAVVENAAAALVDAAAGTAAFVAAHEATAHGTAGPEHVEAAAVARGLILLDERMADGGSPVRHEPDAAAAQRDVPADDRAEDLQARRAVGIPLAGAVGHAAAPDADVVLDQAIGDPDRHGRQAGVVVPERDADAAVAVAGDGRGADQEVADARHLDRRDGVVLAQGHAGAAGIRDQAVFDAGVHGAGVDAVGGAVPDDRVADDQPGVGDDARRRIAVDAVVAGVRDEAVEDGAMLALDPVAGRVADGEAVHGAVLEEDGILAGGQGAGIQPRVVPAVDRGQRDAVGHAHRGGQDVHAVGGQHEIARSADVDRRLDVGGGLRPGRERGNVRPGGRHEPGGRRGRPRADGQGRQTRAHQDPDVGAHVPAGGPSAASTPRRRAASFLRCRKCNSPPCPASNADPGSFPARV